MFKKIGILLSLLAALSIAAPSASLSQGFTSTFGGSSVSPSDVAYAAYSFGSGGLQLYWPAFSNGNPNVAARFMSMTATTSSPNVTMPDATLNSVGYDAVVFNAGSQTFNVVTYNGNAIVTIAPGQTYYLMLTSNTTQDGSWQVIQFGVGTGSAVASQLAGPGLLAYAGLLQVNLNAQTVSNNFTVTQAALGQLYVWNGGSGTITLPPASSVGNGFFFMIANNGSGSVTFAPSSGTIDGNSTSIFSQTQSGFIMSNGSNWYTVGKGIQNTFAITLLNLNVAGGSNVTETSSQAQNIIQNLTGLLTANISVIVPATVQLYIVNNNTTGSYTLEFKTASGSGVFVAQSSTAIVYCDGTNVVNAYSASVSGTLALDAGSAISPSLSFSGETGTGLYTAGSNTFSATANTTQVMQWASQASAVNYFGVVAGATGQGVTLGAAGTDGNININLIPKGTGYVEANFLDATVIGTNVPEAGHFTTLGASGNVTFSGTGNSVGTITSGIWNGTAIGTSYLPTASASALGIVQGDNSTITINGSGVESCTTATTSQLGCVKPDNSTITISGGVISSVPGSAVTNIATNNGITGGPITSTGTIGLATIGTDLLLANPTGSSAVPVGTSLTHLIDVAIGSTQGDILYRNATGWVPLTPGTSGQVLTTGGSSANPTWAGAQHGSQLFTSSGSFSTPSGVTTAYISETGGGGGGGGSCNNCTGGGGGSSGGQITNYPVSVSGSITVTVGGGGGGGCITGDGSIGGTTSFGSVAVIGGNGGTNGGPGGSGNGGNPPYPWASFGGTNGVGSGNGGFGGAGLFGSQVAASGGTPGGPNGYGSGGNGGGASTSNTCGATGGPGMVLVQW